MKNEMALAMARELAMDTSHVPIIAGVIEKYLCERSEQRDLQLYRAGMSDAAKIACFRGCKKGYERTILRAEILEARDAAKLDALPSPISTSGPLSEVKPI